MTRKLIEKKVVLATRNPGKLIELRHLLGGCGIEAASADELGLKPARETADTYAGNAKIKALSISEASHLPAIADDSGLEVVALDGKPGVAAADWAITPHGRDYLKAMTEIWTLLSEISAPEPRTARFCSTICIAWPDGYCEFFEGAVNGRIVWPLRGDEGFGYDPIFLPDGFNQTFGEMKSDLKSKTSHRARSIEAFKYGCLVD